ncbi:MAG: UDP-3-O-(3-hydroxymyristoyl)glucosamine N-acyltransferase [Comamonadaceae bacterium]|jgi:UDP-3-O-[3-hydroxymyristoyl] glucosamine N-acyltransferase|nr:UDP-3-O-(3-hydroxymyristoyl)glucosamine N-acyltransferase [Comamonadaceae bacterium]
MLLLGQIFEALAAQFDARLIGPADLPIAGLAPLETANAEQLSFLSNPKYQSKLAGSQAACVIVSGALEAQARERGAAILVDQPYLYFARVTQIWKQRHSLAPAPGIHASACVHPLAKVSASAVVDAFAVIEADAVVGEGAFIGAHCVVGAGAHIGEQTRLAARVTVTEGCRVGKRCILHPGVVIGADGFGFAPAGGRWEKIEQLGAVRIGDDVEIGANTCVDRGALGDTVIEDGVKLDNLIQIAHNVHVGAHSAMAALVGVAGSARIGAHCTIGGAAGVLGHLSMAEGVHISSFSLVTRSINKPGLYSGFFPIDENADWEKNAATLKQLHGLRERIRQLEAQAQTQNKAP